MTALPFGDDDWIIFPISPGGAIMTVQSDGEPDPTFYCLELATELHIQFKGLIDDLRHESKSMRDYPHGTVSGRVRGCTGPMCMKAKRDHERTDRHRQASVAGKVIRNRIRNPFYVEIDKIVESFQMFLTENN